VVVVVVGRAMVGFIIAPEERKRNEEEKRGKDQRKHTEVSVPS